MPSSVVAEFGEGGVPEPVSAVRNGLTMQIDIETVAGVAAEYEKSAAALIGIADSVPELAFGPDDAGRAYADLGVSIAAGYESVELLFRRWGEASKDNAVRLRSSVAAYSSSDARTAEHLDTAGAR